MRIGDWDLDGFDWDDGNRAKILNRHGIPAELIESVFKRPLKVAFDPGHSQHEPRYLCVGQDEGGRALLVAFTLRNADGKLLLRPISARRMHLKERRRHD